MIYLDTSVVLAQLLSEDRRPPPELWGKDLVASRLLEYELWTRLHARGLAGTHGDAAGVLLSSVAFLSLARTVLARALGPFPMPVRTLDALHLASVSFLRERGHHVLLATYDERMTSVAEAMGLSLFPV